MENVTTDSYTVYQREIKLFKNISTRAMAQQ
jgi:hypothetical protein